jgi:hypothetical protein
MARLGCIAALSVVPAVAAIGTDYAGFIHFHQWNGTYYYPNLADIKMPDGSSLNPDLASDICSADSECNSFGGCEWFRKTNPDADYDMFLAYNATVVPSAVCTIENRGKYHPEQQYLHCADDFGTGMARHIVVTYALPPDLIHSSCLSNPVCIGFRVKNDESSGDILRSVDEAEGWFKCCSNSSIEHSGVVSGPRP